jgi:NTE family protein
MNATSSHPSHSDPTRPTRRALVLGGGGSAGNAWLIGVVAGLFEAGVDVTTADLIVGTSAGATAAAQITAASPTDLLAQLLASPAAPTRAMAGGHGPTPPVNNADLVRGISEAASSASDMRRRMGAAALERAAGGDGTAQERWLATVAARLPSQDWPEQWVRITAVDAGTGEPVVFDRDSGVGLAEAVAASTSNGFGGPPFRIGGRDYIDGGYRRNENADLAAGCDRVLVLSPFGGRSLHRPEWGLGLEAQVDELQADGSQVEVIGPDADALEAFGDNMMNPAARPAAARAGYSQGLRAAGELPGFWG